MSDIRAQLATLASDPDRVEGVNADDLPDLIGAAEQLRAALWARLQRLSAEHSTPTPGPAHNGGPDRLLTADEAAERLGVDRRWIYRHADDLPFARKLSAGTLRFSEKGLQRWVKSR